MDEAVAETDIDRLMSAARSPGAVPVPAPSVTSDELATRLNMRHDGHSPVLTSAVNAHTISLWDIPIFVLYACLGVFTRIWTDVTLYFDFGEDSGFRMFAIAISMALHGFIIAIIASAWRANWEIRVRNFLAMATLGGYLGFRLLTQL